MQTTQPRLCMQSVFLTVVFLLVLSLVVLPAAYGENESKSETKNNHDLAAMYAGKALTGTVRQTMNSGGYTYVQVNVKQGEIWVAIPESKVEKGKTISLAPGMLMTDFTSSTLKKNFPAIIFSPGLTFDKVTPLGRTVPDMPKGTSTGHDNSFAAALAAEQAAPTNPHKNMGTMGATAPQGDSPGSAGAIVPLAEITVNKAAGSASYTVEECFTQAETLHTKQVKVRGQVMKVSRMIMGKNWIHIQDGTGNPMQNQHDLVVTSMAAPEKGTIVTLQGTLSANRDFGAGYTYAVLLEDAVIVSDTDSKKESNKD